MSTVPMLQVDCTLRRGAFSLKADFASDGRATGIFGPSGSGKTSLLHAIAGLVRPADGFIKIAGTLLVNTRARWAMPPHKRRTAVVFQEDRLFPHLSVRDNLLFGYRRVPGYVRRIHPEDVIRFLALDPLLTRRAHEVSGGEARRVALGRALLMSPALLLLDEPLTGLDANLRRTILAYLVDLPRRLDIPLVYVSHTLSDFLAVTERAFEIRGGEVRPVDAPARLLDRAPDDDEPIESLLRGTVLEAGPDPGYARVDVSGQPVTARATAAAAGQDVLLSLSAHEIILAVGAVPRTSARNVLTGRVTETLQAGARVLVTLDIGQPLRAEVTAASVRDLDLRPGVDVHALLKARALRATPLA